MTTSQKITAAVMFSATIGLFGYLLHLENVQTEQKAPVSKPVAEQQVGATVPVAVARFESSLQSSISDSATSMTLVSGTDAAGNALSGFLCFTIDEGTTTVEDVCGTASSTSVTGMTRGISPVTGTSSVSSLKFAHRRGASVKITDHPHVAIHGRILNGNETLPNALVYDSGVSTTTLSGNTLNLASVAYVNGVALQGAPTATGTTPGLVELSTRTQLSAGTAMDGAYTLVPSNGYFTYNPQSATSVPVSNASGKIAQGWLDLSEAWTFTGAVTNTATTTLAATSTAPLILRGVTYSFPSSQGSASTTLINNGSGALSWVTLPQTYANATTSASITGTGNTDITITTGFQPKTIELTLQPSTLGDSGTALVTAVFDATTLRYWSGLYDTNGALALGDFGLNTSALTLAGTGGNNWSFTITIQSISSTGFTLRIAATKTNSPSNATFNIGYKTFSQ